LKIETYKTVALPVVLYGCETWSHTLREERDCGWLRTGRKWWEVSDDNIPGVSQLVPFTEYNETDQMKDKMGTCSTHGIDHSEDLGVDGKIKLEWIL
jgi:hypothetical protein